MDPLHRSRVKEMDIVQVMKRDPGFVILTNEQIMTSGKTSQRRPPWRVMSLRSTAGSDARIAGAGESILQTSKWGDKNYR